MSDYGNGEYPAFVPLEISNEDMQAIVALCSVCDVEFERRTDKGGLTQWRVWKPGYYGWAATVYGANLRVWQAAIKEVLERDYTGKTQYSHPS